MHEWQDSRAKRPLFLMAKPPLGAIAYLPRNRLQASRPVDLLHITLWHIIDLAEHPDTVQKFVALISSLNADPFWVVFDRIVETTRVTLVGSEPMLGFVRFSTALKSHLRNRGLNRIYVPNPHITLSYHRDGLGDQNVDPISWFVEEILLVESVVGETRHIEHARWQL